MGFDPSQELDDNFESMSEIVSNMRSGEVTYAVRDTEIKGLQIKNSDYIGITGGEIKVATPSRLETTKKLIDDMVDASREIVTVFFGNDADEDELDEVVAHIKKVNPDIEVETIEGQQDIYTYIIAVE